MKALFNEISYINLYSSNNKKLINFYRDIVGITPQDNQDEDSHWYGFETKNIIFAIEPQENRKGYPFDFNTNNPILIQFKAESLEQLEEMNKQLETAGVKLLRRSEKRSYGLVTNFTDPDGNILEILLEKKDIKDPKV